MRLSDKVIMVTGAGTGLAHATALHAAREGARATSRHSFCEFAVLVYEGVLMFGGVGFFGY